MDWIQFATFLTVYTAFTLTLWLCSSSETRSDHRALESWTKDMISSIQQEIRAIHLEIKDFHGRLCSLEGRIKDKNNEDL